MAAFSCSSAGYKEPCFLEWAAWPAGVCSKARSASYDFALCILTVAFWVLPGIPQGLCRVLRRSALEPVLFGIDERGFGVEEVEGQAFGLQHVVHELFERFEDPAAEDDVEADGGEEELDVVGAGHDVDV